MNKKQLFLVLSCLAILVVLVVLSGSLFLFRVVESFAPKVEDKWPSGNPSLLSEPTEPWSIPAPTVDTLVVFLPIIDNDRINLDDQFITEILTHSWPRV